MKLRIRENPTFILKIDSGYADTYNHYDGSYLITPKVYAQTMKTKDKVMDNNVNIEKIYCSQTENESGGYTVQIGDI